MVLSVYNWVGCLLKVVFASLVVQFQLPEMSCSHVISLESIIIVCLIDWFCHFWKRGLSLPRIQFQPKVIAVIWMSLIVKSCQRVFFDISWKNPKFFCLNGNIDYKCRLTMFKYVFYLHMYTFIFVVLVHAYIQHCRQFHIRSPVVKLFSFRCRRV